MRWRVKQWTHLSCLPPDVFQWSGPLRCKETCWLISCGLMEAAYGKYKHVKLLICYQRKRKDCVCPEADQVDVGLMTVKSFFFFSLSFLGHVVPVHWTFPPPQTPEFTLFPPPFFSCQNLAEIALFESEYASSTGPNTKLEPLLRVSSYVWPLYQHWPLSLSIPRLDTARTWSVLLLFFVYFSSKEHTDLHFCQSFDFRMCACVTLFGHLGL